MNAMTGVAMAKSKTKRSTGLKLLGKQAVDEGTPETRARLQPPWTEHQPRWYAVHTNARGEWQAHKRLREQGYETLYLHRRATVSHARRKIGVLRPYFPRYLFVAVLPGQSFAAINSTEGVSALVYFGDEPLVIPQRVIAELRTRCDQTGLVPEEVAKTAHLMAEGTEVHITSGTFAGFVGTVALDTGKQVRLWLSLFGRPVEATVPLSSVERVSP